MPKSQTLSNQPLSASLLERIEHDILAGILKNKSKLTEQSLCNKYNVSRTPIREALIQLEQEGLIENIPNRGAFVLGLSTRDISDLFDLRALCEVQAIEWAITRMSESDVNQIKETIDFMEFYTLKDDIDKVLQFNTDFHNAIYNGTKDRILRKTLESYQIYLRHTAPPKTYDSDDLSKILLEHRNIYEAIAARDIEKGKIAMHEHMRQSKLRRVISE